MEKKPFMSRDALYSIACCCWLFSHSIVFNSLQPHGLQHARLPCNLDILNLLSIRSWFNGPELKFNDEWYKYYSHIGHIIYNDYISFLAYPFLFTSFNNLTHFKFFFFYQSIINSYPNSSSELWISFQMFKDPYVSGLSVSASWKHFSISSPLSRSNLNWLIIYHSDPLTPFF